MPSMFRGVAGLVLLLMPSCRTSDVDEAILRGDLVVRDLAGGRSEWATRAGVLAAARGDRSRVVVISADDADDAVLVDRLRLWRRAGTSHVLPLQVERLESAPGLIRLAHVVEIADEGPTSALGHQALLEALRERLPRGLVLVRSRGAKRCAGLDW